MRVKKPIPGQLSVLEYLPELDIELHKKTIRASWSDYGIDDKRRLELKQLCRQKEYYDLVCETANETQPELAAYIIMSVINRLSYDGLIRKWELREVDLIPCGRTDFYGYRRLFYHKFDERLKE